MSDKRSTRTETIEAAIQLVQSGAYSQARELLAPIADDDAKAQAILAQVNELDKQNGQQGTAMRWQIFARVFCGVAGIFGLGLIVIGQYSNPLALLAFIFGILYAIGLIRWENNRWKLGI